MIKKILTWALVATVVFAIWKVSGGNLGVAATNAWNFTFDLLNTTSDWAITFWNNVNPF